jgi:hypothetical protein
MSKQPLETLLEFFPSGTAEGERHVLREAFVQADEYAELMTPPPHNPRLLVGKKGSGKSALIDFFLRLMDSGGVPNLLVKPMDIDLSGVGDSASVGEVTRLAYEALLRAMAMKLVSSKPKLISTEDRPAYEAAANEGHRKRDVIERLASLLPRLAKPFVAVDFSVLLPDAPVATRQHLESTIRANLSGSAAGFYLFLDDIDQLASPEQKGHLNRIWAFILATRALAERCGELRVIISLRDEVWRRLTRDGAGQRDQTDHFSTLVGHLSPTRAQIGRIVGRRLKLAALRLGDFKAEWPFPMFFEGGSPRMPSSDERSGWEDLIVQRSRERPRDAIQLINAIASYARKKRMSRIDDEVFAEVMKSFSSERVTFLAQEVELECSVAREIVRSLARLDFEYGSFKANPEAVRQHLSRLPSSFSITLYGKTLHPENDESAFSLWRFLWDNGVLNARVRDGTQKDGYRHLRPSEDPSLIAKSRWNEMQGIRWEINPVYRDHLIEVQREAAKRA